MKNVILTLVFLLLGMIAMAQGPAKADDSWYRSGELKRLVIQYGDALNDMTAASLAFGGDTETQWAADTVKTIWTRCKSKPFDFLPYMADITLMQSYFSYGVTYLPLMLYWSKHFQEVQNGEYTYKNFFDDCRDTKDSLYTMLQQKPNWQDYFFMSITTYALQDVYVGMMNDLNEEDSEPQFAAMKLSPFIDSLYVTPDITPEYYAWKIDGTIFFITCFQWIATTIDRSQDNTSVIDEIKAYADVFDSYTNPIINAIIEHRPLPELTASDDKEYLMKTLPIRTKMLKILESNLKSYINN